MTKSKTPTILIVGTTGNIGRELTKQLLAQKVPFRAMVRSTKGLDAFSQIEGLEIIVGDLNDAKTVADALKGIERAFLLTNSSEQAQTQQLTLASIGFPNWQAEGLIEDYAHYHRGEASTVTTDIKDATSKPPHSFEEFARDYAPEFSA